MPSTLRSEAVALYLLLSQQKFFRHRASGNYAGTPLLKDWSMHLSAENRRMGITYTIAASPLGRLLVAATPKGICMISAGDSDRALERRIHDQFPKEAVLRDDAGMKKHLRAVEKMVNGNSSPSTLMLDLRGTPFQKKVWNELLRIPAGQTRSYAEIARRIKHPTAYRAVANACGANPVAIVVPCHRVIASDGSLGGYGLGLPRKRLLLANEGSG
jgi:AraC family transcriptional regulator, regulatory protein of adaptative response / methylated-DNA-[protein]-cysteine methyltransferase